MTSPKRRPDRPIESVELRISFKAGREAAAKIKQAFPQAVLRNGGCEVKLTGKEPSEVAEKARDLLEGLRSIVEGGPAGK